MKKNRKLPEIFRCECGKKFAGPEDRAYLMHWRDKHEKQPAAPISKRDLDRAISEGSQETALGAAFEAALSQSERT